MAHNEQNHISVAVAGDVFVRSNGEIKRGPSAVARIWTESEMSLSETNGAFVCIVYDAENGRITAFNDFVGQIPLFYTKFQSATYFATQLAPFLLNETIPKFIDRRGLNLLFSFGCIPGSDTILAGIKKILPGTVATISEKSVQTRKYWRIGDIKSDNSSSLEDFIERISKLLGSSVQSKLSSAKRPIGVLLGGLDSSLISSLLRESTAEKIIAVTASFEDTKFNERAARQVSDLLELDLKEVSVASEEMPEIIEAMAEAFDEPVADMIASPIAFAITKKSLRFVNTFFDGTGADDLFQGIPHSGRKLDLLSTHLPNSLRSGLQNGLDLTSRWHILNGRLFRRVKPILLSPAEKELLSWRIMQEDQVDNLPAKSRTPKYKRSESVLKPIVKDIELDIKGMIRDPANIYVKTAVSFYFGPTHGFDCSRNRAISSRFGISIVSPFYDKELYKAGLSVPWYYKTPSGGLSKPLLRRIAIEKNLLPASIALLKKMGLGSSRQSLVDAQMKIWVMNELSSWVLNTIKENYDLVGHLINKNEMTNMLVKGRASQIFQILMFVLWYKKYFGGRVIALHD